jgi:hypothetical protein
MELNATGNIFTGPKKERFPEIDEAGLFYFFIFLMACRVALSFFQNPTFDCESSPHLIFCPLELFKGCRLDSGMYGSV